MHLDAAWDDLAAKHGVEPIGIEDGPRSQGTTESDHGLTSYGNIGLSTVGRRRNDSCVRKDFGRKAAEDSVTEPIYVARVDCAVFVHVGQERKLLAKRIYSVEVSDETDKVQDDNGSIPVQVAQKRR